MFSYIVLNLIFITAVLVAMRILLGRQLFQFSSRAGVVLVLLLVLTLIFDNLIIAAGIVDYNFDKTLGIIIFKMPIEDIFYSVMALLLMHTLWRVVK
jgi:lycopene cyclase domain-containing protein